MPPTADSPASRSARIVAIAVLCAALGAVALWLFGPLLGAVFGLIDDHEIVSALGPDHTLSVGEIPGLLAQTEVAQWGTSTRYRPVYYLLRLLETAAWGDNGSAWYAVRIALGLLTAALIAVVAVRSFAPVGATLRRVAVASAVAFGVGVLVLAAPAWSDIVMRLGPSEIYLAPALAAVALGIQSIWRAPERSSGWIVLLAGAVIAIGSKENGAVVVLAVAGVFALRIGGARLRLLWTVLSALVVAFGLFVLLGVAIAVRAAGSDIYQKDRSLGSSLHFLSETIFQSRYFAIVLVVLALCLLVDRTVRYAPAPVEGSGWRGRLRRLATFAGAHPHVLVSLLLLIFAITEGLFYRAEFFPPRYAIVSELLVIVALVVLADALLRMRGAGRVSAPVAIVVLAAVVMASGAVFDLKVAVSSFRGSAAGVAASTRDVQSDIAAIGRLVEQKPGAQVLIIAGNPDRDYERIASLGRYLYADGIADDAFLRTDFAGSGSALEAGLEDTARTGYEPWRILPWSAFDPSADTVCVYFEEGITVPSECDASQLVDG